MEDRFLLMADVSEITRLSIDTLRYLRKVGDGPPSFRLGRRVVYSEGALREWIRQHQEADASSARRGDAA